MEMSIWRGNLFRKWNEIYFWLIEDRRSVSDERFFFLLSQAPLPFTVAGTGWDLGWSVAKKPAVCRSRIRSSFHRRNQVSNESFCVPWRRPPPPLLILRNDTLDFSAVRRSPMAEDSIFAPERIRSVRSPRICESELPRWWLTVFFKLIKRTIFERVWFFR